VLVICLPEVLQDNVSHMVSDWGSSGRRFKSCQPDQRSSRYPIGAEWVTGAAHQERPPSVIAVQLTDSLNSAPSCRILAQSAISTTGWISYSRMGTNLLTVSRRSAGLSVSTTANTPPPSTLPTNW
jgi:hypothetical protein